MDPRKLDLKNQNPEPSTHLPAGEAGNPDGKGIARAKLPYWITVHKIQLRRGGILALSFIAGALLVYGLVGLTNYYGFELPKARR